MWMIKLSRQLTHQKNKTKNSSIGGENQLIIAHRTESEEGGTHTEGVSAKFSARFAFTLFSCSRLTLSVSSCSSRSVTRSYFRNSAGSLLVFDIGNRESFDHIKKWHSEVREHVQPHTIMFVLVGQKSDLEAEGQRVVSREEAEELAEELGATYSEVSAKTGLNVSDTFQLLAQRIYQGLLSGEVKVQNGWDGIKCSGPLLLHSRRASKARAQRKKKCCG